MFSKTIQSWKSLGPTRKDPGFLRGVFSASLPPPHGGEEHINGGNINISVSGYTPQLYFISLVTFRQDDAVSTKKRVLTKGKNLFLGVAASS